MERIMVLKCIVCNKSLAIEPDCPPSVQVPRNDDIQIVYRGLFFRATGNYGSQIYDPFGDNEGHLEVVVCDVCVMAKAESHAIRHTIVDGRQIIAEDVPFQKWRKTSAGKEWLAKNSKRYT
jgi:hypothetical protein